MYNLIRMELRHLFRSFSFLVMVAVALLLAVFNVYLIHWDINEYEQSSQPESAQPQEAAQETEDDLLAGFGIEVQTDADWLGGPVGLDGLNQVVFSSGMYLILCAVFVALFVHSDYKNGFVKNIAGQLPGRGWLALSKAVAVAVQVAVLLLLCVIFNTVAGLCFFQSQIVLGSLPTLLRVVGLQYLLHLAFSWFIMLLCLLTHSAGLGMTFGILAASGVLSLVYWVVNRLLHCLPSLSSFQINLYTLEANVVVITSSISGGVLLRVLTVGFGFALGSLMLSILLLNRRDIR